MPTPRHVEPGRVPGGLGRLGGPNGSGAPADPGTPDARGPAAAPGDAGSAPDIPDTRERVAIPDAPGTPADPDARRLAAVMHATFFLLLGTSMARYIQRHGGEPRAPWVIALAVVLGVLYVMGRFGDRSDLVVARPAASRPTPPRLLWLGAVVAVWVVLVALAPSFAWVAVPLFYVALRHLPPGAAYALVGVLTVFVIVAQLQLAPRFDLDLVVGPAAVAGFATAVFVQLRRQAARQRALIDDLVRTRRELAATERREGTLAERQRLAMEIHDTLAQGLSSQQMLLQAAERIWESDPAKARAHVRTAESVAEHNLTEARRFVHDLAPADLARGGGLGEALRTLAARESGEALTVRVHLDDAGRAPELPDRVQSALLRIAQGALANVREHSGAASAALTLTLLDDQAVLDVADDGHGFDPAALAAPSGVRGHGLPAIRARVRQLGGTLTVESAPGEGTVLSAAIPLENTESSP
ncbi:integral membrane sensor signal transduction histidine kinase [Streptomyces davaonensis JCM 4913]|uniref:Oxygen sensor histidine kinase NreB n=1 Tax=Streptomyces davaonensis (strain DSM 101723 / JCM 4913 / KCC S-0913 / 768) TaxID=1214101 RepID=K4R0V6_STRDJ|nr:integral membrane sensor signal transduction histidine kinase [Streptomyces davaonensis JCM 4913]